MLLEFARQPGDTLIADARDYITYSEKDFVPCKAERGLTEYTAGSKKTLTENHLNDIAIIIYDNSAIYIIAFHFTITNIRGERYDMFM